jgi:hypothetical protein
MKILKKYNEFNNVNEEAMITLSRRVKVDVPEKDITDAIEAITNWFDKNPDKDICRPQMFGFEICDIHRNSIEKDVRFYADNAKPYNKV